MRLRAARPRDQRWTDLVTESDPRSAASEAYRALRTNFQFAGLDEPCRSVVFTSAMAGEGKTTSLANFGVVSAQAGSRVCLVDSDLRRPTLHRIFGVDNAHGLTTALIDGSSLAQAARPTRVPHLSLVTSGPLPPNPAELVGSKHMHDLLEGAAPDFDLVLCDSPPVMAVADGVALAARCDGVILIVRAGLASHDVIRRAVGQIQSVKGKILGVLLNAVNLNREGYPYPYYRDYLAHGDEGA